MSAEPSDAVTFSDLSRNPRAVAERARQLGRLRVTHRDAQDFYLTAADREEERNENLPTAARLFTALARSESGQRALSSAIAKVFPGPLPPGRVRVLGAGLAEGLAAIHACGLVHRDLKPGNVIMAADGPRIIDFGIARTVDASTGITTTGAVVGTFAYMSPEQIRGEVAGPASDVFSVGGVLAFVATGRPPFGSDSAVSIMYRIVNQPPDLAGLGDGELRDVISACLAKSATDRPAVQA